MRGLREHWDREPQLGPTFHGGSVARLCKYQILEHVDVALQIRAPGIAAHDVAQQRERALVVLLIDRELRQRDQGVLAIVGERARALERDLRAAVVALVEIRLTERSEE